MRFGLGRLALAVSLVIAAATTMGVGPVQKTIRIALQEGGTASWEAAAMRALGLDTHHGIRLDIRPVADSRAGQVALQSRRVDVILSDFVWTSIQRHQGADFTLVPHSLAVGGLMAMPGSPVASVADLQGKTVAIAGGPVDKSYVVLQAYYKAQTGRDLPADIDAKFGAPPLVNELLASGGAQASLNFWHFNARAKAAGATELISVKDMLANLGVTKQPPLLGWVFSERNAERKPDEFKRFLDASFETKERLLSDDAVWERIRPEMNVGDDDALFIALRDAYRAGIVTSYGDDDIAAAEQSFALMAEYGGSELIGDTPTLAEGTFWTGYRK